MVSARQPDDMRAARSDEPGRRAGAKQPDDTRAARSGEPGQRVGGRRVRELGQNFLVDRNLLDVIEGLAQLRDDEVVLEIGGGLGVLSQRLAARVSHLHVVEVDRRLAPRLNQALAPFTNVSLHIADALALDLHGLTPPPHKVVANLPYGIAATIILKTIEELAEVSEWVVMVQREVGERFAAAPGGDAYGVPSVLAQIACDVALLRPVSRNVFRPVPRVDSVLLGLRRRGPAAGDELRALVHDAFAHRRKALAGSLALSARALPGVRERARAALVELGHPADERAERLSPEEFCELARRLAA
jgi:16S rRNA (adenine1518-N6/adenine1519-N6)-dimethyltransferase